MIEIDAAFDAAGLLRSCTVRAAGGDIVCAAVSILAGTAFRTLSEQEGIQLRGGAAERGRFCMETGYSQEGKDFLKGAGAFLINGLQSVSDLYPEYCTLRIQRRK